MLSCTFIFFLILGKSGLLAPLLYALVFRIFIVVVQRRFGSAQGCFTDAHIRSIKTIGNQLFADVNTRIRFNRDESVSFLSRVYLPMEKNTTYSRLEDSRTFLFFYDFTRYFEKYSLRVIVMVVIVVCNRHLIAAVACFSKYSIDLF